MTLEEELIVSVDKIVKKLNITRSAFTRKALRDAIKQFQINLLEEKHRKGYKTFPVKRKEFSVWEKEQDWGDE